MTHVAAEADCPHKTRARSKLRYYSLLCPSERTRAAVRVSQTQPFSACDFGSQPFTSISRWSNCIPKPLTEKAVRLSGGFVALVPFVWQVLLEAKPKLADLHNIILQPISETRESAPQQKAELTPSEALPSHTLSSRFGKGQSPAAPAELKQSCSGAWRGQGCSRATCSGKAPHHHLKQHPYSQTKRSVTFLPPPSGRSLVYVYGRERTHRAGLLRRPGAR